MKVLGIFGSPRDNSNSTALAEKVLETTRDLGAETEVFKLNEMNYVGCQACSKCRTESDWG